MTKRSAAESLVSATAKIANVKQTIQPLSTTEAIDYSKLPLSTRPVLCAERNLELEKLYLATQKKFKPKYNSATDSRPPNPNSVRKPKKQVALLLSYCGEGYQGMQINPTVPTIELDLFKALAEAGAVSEPNAMDGSKFNFMRCARTDKGVKLVINSLGSCCRTSGVT